MEQRVYRMQVTEHFLKAGLPLSKVDDLRPVLEQKFRPTSQTRLRKLIPTILEQGQQRLASEIKGHAISVVFDVTTRLGEAIAIIVRFLDNEWCVQQRLIRLRTVAKAVNAPQLAQVINDCLATQFQYPAELLVAMMRDGASVNMAAIRALSVFYPNVLDVVCALHTLNNASQHFDFPLLQFLRIHQAVDFSFCPQCAGEVGLESEDGKSNAQPLRDPMVVKMGNFAPSKPLLRRCCPILGRQSRCVS